MFTAQGSPNRSTKSSKVFYELPPEDGSPRYLRMHVDYNDRTVFGFSMVDDRQWLCRLFQPQEEKQE